MGSYVKKKIEYLVVDTSAFINKAEIQEMGEKVFTVPQVIEEIKSQRQLRRLVVLPYDLSVKEAFPENIKFVSEFSKKTGDYASLSVTDINVIALTYQLEKEKNGISHLNSAPVSKPAVQSIETIPEDLRKIAGFYAPKKVHSRTDSTKSGDEASEYDSAEEEIYDSTEDEFYDSAEDLESVNVSKENDINNKETQFNVKENGCQLKIINENEVKDDLEENVNGEECTENCNKDEIEEENEGDKKDDNDGDFGNDNDNDGDGDDEDDDDNDNEEEDEDEDDDDSHWITPSNIEKVKNQIASELKEDFENVTVACLTTDFAMQNVLKQIGLHVISLDGKLIKQLRTFILRCYGCFKTTSIMTKVFCPNCGNKTLKRVGVSLDENGTQRLHINFRKPLTARGKRFSVPRFKGGKHSNNPIVCEDQPMPQQRPSRLSRTKNNPLNDDYIAGYSPFVTRDVTSKSAMLGIKPHLEMKHWMRKNPNESRKKKK